MTHYSYDDEVEKYYKNLYLKVHSSGVLGKANRIIHKRLESKRSGEFRDVLELGSGNFEHYPFVKHQYDNYLALDIRNPPAEKLNNFINSHKGNQFKIGDATNLDFEDYRFDRLVAGCLIVHLVDVKQAINEWQRVTKLRGVIDFVVPCDPGILLRIFRKIISMPHAKKIGVSPKTYELINAYEHVSSFSRTLQIIENNVCAKRELRIRYSPFPFLKSWNLNAFAIVSIIGKGDD